MKKARMIGLVLLATVGFTLSACGDDDDSDGGGVCTDYCAEQDSIDCLGGMSVDDCEAFCQAFVDEETCGSEYEAYVECSVGNMECNGGFVEVTGCDDEYEAYNDCASS